MFDSTLMSQFSVLDFVSRRWSSPEGERRTFLENSGKSSILISNHAYSRYTVGGRDVRGI